MSGLTSWSLHLQLQTGLQQVDRVGGGEDEGGGEAVDGDDQHWDWGTPRPDCLHLDCSHTGQSGNRYDFLSTILSMATSISYHIPPIRAQYEYIDRSRPMRVHQCYFVKT